MQFVLPNQMFSWIKSSAKVESEGWKIQILQLFKSLQLHMSKRTVTNTLHLFLSILI